MARRQAQKSGRATVKAPRSAGLQLRGAVTPVSTRRGVGIGAGVDGSAPGTAMPPGVGAPLATPPIQTRKDQNAVAPWPLVDRYPLVIGTRLTAGYLAQVFLMALTGYRMQLVDLLDELLEMDGHLYSVIEKRILSTANGRIEIKAADIPENHPDFELAREVAEMVQAEVKRIKNLTQSVATLLWGIYYGISAAEIFWTRDADGMHVERLDFIHSRRLGYPDMQSWTLHVWDQGQVLGFESAWGNSPTNQDVFGTAIADWPGKFIVYAPQLRGDYPTREGLGRQVAVWSLFKRAGVRGGMEYLERFAKGFLDGTYSTQDDGNPREATPEDKATLLDALEDVGPGRKSYAMHPDNTKIEMKGYEGAGTSKVGYCEWADFCDGQNSKIALGGTLSTDHHGSGGLGGSGTAEVQERGEVDLEQYDATCFAESFRESVVYWLVRMNRPEGLRVLPQVFINVDREPDAKTVLQNAKSMTEIGGRVDLDKVSDQTGTPLIPQEEAEDGEVKPRGSFLSDVVDPTMVHEDLKSDEAKQAEQDQIDNDHEVAKIKAQQPVVAPPGAAAGTKKAAGPKGKAGTPPNGKAKPKVGKKPTKMSADDEAQAGPMLLLLSARADSKPAREVYEQLLEDYPAWACAWVLAGKWLPVQRIPLEDIDFSNRDKWRASHDGTIPSYVEKIKSGIMKPAIYVKTPGNPKFVPVDGHHRTLAYESMGEPVPAYVLETHSDHGPWLELHAMQKKGSSKGGSRVSSYTSVFPEDNASFTPKGNVSTTMNAKPNADLRAAAIAVVIDAHGNILTVSRPEPPYEQAFPGGIVDPGETPDQACLRELLEETGVVGAREADGTPIVEPLFTTSSPSDGRIVYVYAVPLWSGVAFAAEPATTVEWMTVEAFFAQSVLFRDLVRELMARRLLSPAAANDAAAQ